MKKLTLLATLIFFVMFSSNVVLSETVKWDDLVEHDGLYYNKSHMFLLGIAFNLCPEGYEV